MGSYSTLRSSDQTKAAPVVLRRGRLLEQGSSQSQRQVYHNP